MYTVHSGEKKSRAIRRFVLTELATEGMFSWYDRLFKQIKHKAYKEKNGKLSEVKIYKPHVWNAIQKLEQNGDIYVEKKARRIGGKGPLKKPVYITKRGLFKLLAEDETWKLIDEIAPKQKDKLPIFEYWDHFVNEKVRDKVIAAMQIFFRDHLPYSSKELSKMNNKMRERALKFLESRIPANLTHYILFLPLLLPDCPDEALNWLRVWMKQPDLKDYMIEEFHREQQRSSEINRFLEYVESVEKNEN